MVFTPVKFFHRFIAVGVLCAFLCTNLFANDTVMQSKVTGTMVPVTPLVLSKLSVPEKFGKVEDVFQGSGKSTVILIQDAHAIPEAQQNIQKMIEYFQKEYGIHTVAAEGASGELDPQMLRSFPDKDQLEKTIGEYYSRSEISGVTAAAILSPYQSQYRGVEDWNLYQQGVGLFLAAMQQKSSLESDLSRKQQDLNRRKKEIYSAELLKFDEAYQAFQKKQTELAPFLKYLVAIQKPAKGSLIEAILREIKKEEEGFDARKKSNLLEKMQKMQGSKFYEELEVYITGIKNSLLKTEAQKHLDQESHQLDLMEKLIRLELSRNEWKEIKNTLSPIALRHFPLPLEGGKGQGEGEGLTAASFYKNAEAREHAFIENLNQHVGPEVPGTVMVPGTFSGGHGNDGRVVFITGGFHTLGLTEKFRRQNISYAVISPAMQNIPDNIPYLQHMQGNVSWKKYFQPRPDGKINLYEAFIRGMRDELLGYSPLHLLGGEGQGVGVIKHWRDQIIRDLAGKKQIETAREYTRFLDEMIIGASLVDGLGARQVSSLLSKIDRFIAELQNLKNTSNLTPQNIVNILNRPAIVDLVSAPAVLGHTSNISPIEELIRQASRSETRIAQTENTQRITREELEQIRRRLFGNNVDYWLMEHKKNGKKEERQNAIQELAKNPDFQVLIKKNAEWADILSWLISRNINLHTRSLMIFSNEFKKALPKTLSQNISVIQLPLAAYVTLIVDLHTSAIQTFLEGEEYKKLDREDRLGALVAKILDLGLELESENLGQIYSALPAQLSETAEKKGIQKVELPMQVYLQVRAALKHKEVQKYLEGEEYKKLDRGDRLGALVAKILDLGLELESENLGHIYSALPVQLSETAEKKGTRSVILPMRVYLQVRAALKHKEVQKYLEGEEYKKLDREDRLGALVAKILDLGLELESENLGQIYSALPAQLSGTAEKKGIRKVELSMRVYLQVRAALKHKEVQKYLEGDEYKKLDREDRLGALVAKILDLGLELESENLGHIYSALPVQLSETAEKKGTRSVILPMRVYLQVRAALKHKEVQKYLEGEEYKKLDRGDRLGALVAKILDLGLELESENLGQIHSALPFLVKIIINFTLPLEIQRIGKPALEYDRAAAQDFVISKEMPPEMNAQHSDFIAAMEQIIRTAWDYDTAEKIFRIVRILLESGVFLTRTDLSNASGFSTEEVDRILNLLKNESRIGEILAISHHPLESEKPSRAEVRTAPVTERSVEWTKMAPEMRIWLEQNQNTRDGALFQKLLTVREEQLWEMLTTPELKDKVYIGFKEQEHLYEGRTVYLRLDKPIRDMEFLRLKGARPRTRREQNIVGPYHGVSGSVEKYLTADANGDFVVREDMPDPHGGMTLESAEYEFSVAQQVIETNLRSDQPLAVGKFSGIFYRPEKISDQRIPMGFVVYGMKAADIRLRAALRGTEASGEFRSLILPVDWMTGEIKSLPHPDKDIAYSMDLAVQMGRFLRKFHDARFYHHFSHPGNYAVLLIDTNTGKLFLRDFNNVVERRNFQGPDHAKNIKIETAYRVIDLFKTLGFLKKIQKEDFDITVEKITGTEDLLDAFLQGYFGQSLEMNSRLALVQLATREDFSRNGYGVGYRTFNVQGNPSLEPLWQAVAPLLRSESRTDSKEVIRQAFAGKRLQIKFFDESGDEDYTGLDYGERIKRVKARNAQRQLEAEQQGRANLEKAETYLRNLPQSYQKFRKQLGWDPESGIGPSKDQVEKILEWWFQDNEDFNFYARTYLGAYPDRKGPLAPEHLEQIGETLINFFRLLMDAKAFDTKASHAQLQFLEGSSQRDDTGEGENFAETIADIFDEVSSDIGSVAFNVFGFLPEFSPEKAKEMLLGFFRNSPPFFDQVTHYWLAQTIFYVYSKDVSAQDLMQYLQKYSRKRPPLSIWGLLLRHHRENPAVKTFVWNYARQYFFELNFDLNVLVDAYGYDDFPDDLKKKIEFFLHAEEADFSKEAKRLGYHSGVLKSKFEALQHHIEISRGHVKNFEYQGNTFKVRVKDIEDGDSLYIYLVTPGDEQEIRAANLHLNESQARYELILNNDKPWEALPNKKEALEDLLAAALELLRTQNKILPLQFMPSLNHYLLTFGQDLAGIPVSLIVSLDEDAAQKNKPRSEVRKPYPMPVDYFEHPWVKARHLRSPYTSLVRWPGQLAYLKKHAMPLILGRQGKKKKSLKIAFLGVHTGEELASAFYALTKTLEKGSLEDLSLEFVANDLDADALEEAQKRFFGESPFVYHSPFFDSKLLSSDKSFLNDHKTVRAVMNAVETHQDQLRSSIVFVPGSFFTKKVQQKIAESDIVFINNPRTSKGKRLDKLRDFLESQQSPPLIISTGAGLVEKLHKRKYETVHVFDRYISKDGRSRSSHRHDIAVPKIFIPEPSIRSEARQPAGELSAGGEADGSPKAAEARSKASNQTAKSIAENILTSFKQDAARDALPTLQEIASSEQVSGPYLRRYFPNVITTLEARIQKEDFPVRNRVGNAIELWKQKKSKRKIFDLDRTVDYVIELFKEDPYRYELPLAPDFSDLGLKQMTLYIHWFDILAGIEAKMEDEKFDPKLKKRIKEAIETRRSKWSRVPFNLKATIEQIVRFFQEDPERVTFPSREELSAILGPSTTTFYFHASEIVATLHAEIEEENLGKELGTRIQKAIERWVDMVRISIDYSSVLPLEDNESTPPFDIDQSAQFIVDLFINDLERTGLPTIDELVSSTTFSRPLMRRNYPELVKNLEIKIRNQNEALQERITKAIDDWKSNQTKTFNLERTVEYLIGLFRDEPKRKKIPLDPDIAAKSEVSKATIYSHLHEILIELDARTQEEGFDPKLAKRITKAIKIRKSMWRLVKFDLDATINRIIKFFEEDESRTSLPAREVLSSELGPSTTTFYFHQEEIITTLKERIQDKTFDKDLGKRIAAAIEAWPPGHKVDIDATVNFIVGSFKQEPTRQIFPTLKEIASGIEGGLASVTYGKYFSKILDALEAKIQKKGFNKKLRARIETAIKSRTEGNSAVDYDATIDNIIGTFRNESDRKRLPSMHQVSAALGGPTYQAFYNHYSTILEKLENKIQEVNFDLTLRDRIKEAISKKRRSEARTKAISFKELPDGVEVDVNYEPNSKLSYYEQINNRVKRINALQMKLLEWLRLRDAQDISDIVSQLRAGVEGRPRGEHLNPFREFAHNAFKALEESRNKKKSTRFRIRKLDQQIHFEVLDTGSGILPAAWQSIGIASKSHRPAKFRGNGNGIYYSFRNFFEDFQGSQIEVWSQWGNRLTSYTYSFNENNELQRRAVPAEGEEDRKQGFQTSFKLVFPSNDTLNLRSGARRLGGQSSSRSEARVETRRQFLKDLLGIAVGSRFNLTGIATWLAEKPSASMSAAEKPFVDLFRFYFTPTNRKNNPFLIPQLVDQLIENPETALAPLKQGSPKPDAKETQEVLWFLSGSREIIQKRIEKNKQEKAKDTEDLMAGRINKFMWAEEEGAFRKVWAPPPPGTSVEFTEEEQERVERLKKFKELPLAVQQRIMEQASQDWVNYLDYVFKVAVQVLGPYTGRPKFTDKKAQPQKKSADSPQNHSDSIEKESGPAKDTNMQPGSLFWRHLHDKNFVRPPLPYANRHPLSRRSEARERELSSLAQERLVMVPPAAGYNVVGQNKAPANQKRESDTNKHNRIHLNASFVGFENDGATKTEKKENNRANPQTATGLSEKIADKSGAQSELGVTGEHVRQPLSFFGADQSFVHNVSSAVPSVKIAEENMIKVNNSQEKNDNKSIEFPRSEARMGAGQSVPRGFWTKEKIIMAIKLLNEHQIPLHSTAIKNDDSQKTTSVLQNRFGYAITGKQVYWAAGKKKLFGSWEHAVLAAGIDYGKNILKEKHMDWSREKIILGIQTLHQFGIPLNAWAISQDQTEQTKEILNKLYKQPVTGKALYKAAAELATYFKNWDTALEASGFDPQEIRKRETTWQWTDAQIIEAIFVLYQHNVPLNHNAIEKDDSKSTKKILMDYFQTKISITGKSLVISARRPIHFKAWGKALEAAGIDPDNMMRSGQRMRGWSAPMLIKAIHALYENNVPLSHYEMATNLSENTKRILKDIFGLEITGAAIRQAALSVFGSWDKALSAVGLNPGEIRKKSWSKRPMIHVPYQTEVVDKEKGILRRLIGRPIPGPVSEAQNHELLEQLDVAVKKIPSRIQPLAEALIGEILSSSERMSLIELSETVRDWPQEDVVQVLDHLRNDQQLSAFILGIIEARSEVRKLGQHVWREIQTQGNVTMESAEQVIVMGVDETLVELKRLRAEAARKAATTDTEYVQNAYGRIQQIADFAARWRNKHSELFANQKSVVAVSVPRIADEVQAKMLAERDARQAASLSGSLSQMMITGNSLRRALFQRSFEAQGVKAQPVGNPDDVSSELAAVLPLIYIGRQEPSDTIRRPVVHIAANRQNYAGDSHEDSTEAVMAAMEYLIATMASLMLKPEKLRQADLAELLRELGDLGMDINGMFQIEDGRIGIVMSQIQTFIESYRSELLTAQAA